MSSRGPYAKSAAMRERALDAALRIISERGLSHTTIQQIADEVGTTKAGLIYHFGGREQLLLAVLERSNEINDISAHGPSALDSLIELVKHNLEVPGVVAAYLGMSGETAASRGHSDARRHFTQHYAAGRAGIAADIRAGQKSGRFRSDIDADTAALLVLSASDGSQVQQLIDGSVDALSALTLLRRLLERPAAQSTPTRELEED